MLAYVFGTSREVEIFRVAFGLPSVLSDSLAVSFVAILIRLILSAEKNRPAQALRQAVWASVAVAFAVYAIGFLTMPLQARWLAPGMSEADHAKLIFAGRVCWTMFLFVILSLPLRSLMSARGRIWPGAASQAIRSGGFVVVLLVLVFVLGREDVTAPAAAAAVGGATVLVVHIFALGKQGRRRFANVVGQLRPPEFRVLEPTLFALATVVLTQILLSAGRLMDRAAATLIEEGMLAALDYSYALVMAVGALLGTSTNLVLAPRMGRSIRDSGRLSKEEWRLIFAITGVATVIGLALSGLGDLIVRVVYQYGAFDATAAALTSSIFRIHALALGPLILALLLTQVLIASGKQKSVTVAAIGNIFIKLLSLLSVMHFGWGVQGIAATLIIAETTMVMILGSQIARQPRPC
nr:lipid II flippase MurJ [Thioalkalivibrio sp. XN8]